MAKTKNMLDRYTQEFVALILDFLKENKKSLIGKLGDLINFKKRLSHYIVFWVAVLAAVILILDGVGLFLGSFFPGLRPGTTNILVGAVFILAALAYEKLR